MDKAPFLVKRYPDLDPRWGLFGRKPHRFHGWFPTQGEAIDYAYKHWPWWP